MSYTRPLSTLKHHEGQQHLRYVEVYSVSASSAEVKSLWWDGDSYEPYGLPYTLENYESESPAAGVGERLWIAWRNDRRAWEPLTSDVSADTVILLSGVSAASGTDKEYTPTVGSSPRYYPHPTTADAWTYDDTGNDVEWEWWSTEPVGVTSGHGRLAHVIGRKLIPLCVEIVIS